MNNENVGSIEYDARILTRNLKKDSHEVEGIAKKTGDDLGNNIEKGSGRASSSLQQYGEIAKTVSIAAGVALATGVATAAKASWDQVSAVQQATIALGAYEKDGSKVSKVLSELLSYARSDAGVLFNRKDLFAAAQGLKIMGAETSKLADYTKIMSRSVGLGLSTFEGLGNVIQRVGSTGKLYADDLQFLQNAGFRLDSTLSGTTQTFETLFEHLDKGIPVDAMKGQANTIKGLGIRMETAFRGIGDAVLGVDSDTSEFVKGGLGDSLMNGLGSATKALKSFQQPIRDLITWVGASKDMLISMGAAFLTYNAVTIAATGYTKGLALAQGILNAAMKLNPFALVAGAAIGIVTAYMQVTAQSDRTTGSTGRLKAAQDALRISTDSAKVAQDALRGALLSEEGAALAVERAQRAYNAAVAQYGPKSYEAREAAYGLKRANDDLARANADVRDRTNEARVAEENKTRARDNFVATNNAIGQSARNAAGGYAALRDNINQAIEADRKAGNAGLSGKNVTNTIFGIPGRAVGGPVSANSPYFVGENPDGSLNRTSELFVPRSSGSIVNSGDLQEALGGGSKSEIVYNIGTISIGSEVDGDRWLRKLTQNQEIVGKGLTPQTKYA